MALADIILKGNAGFVSKGDSACNGSRVEVNQFFGDAALVKPQVLQVHLHAVQLGVFGLPLVNVQCNESHYSLIFKLLIIFTSGSRKNRELLVNQSFRWAPTHQIYLFFVSISSTAINAVL